MTRPGRSGAGSGAGRRADPREVIEAFKAAMLQEGIEPPEDIRLDTQRLVRFRAGNERGRSGFYRLHTDGIPAGVFGCWRGGIKETWCLRRETEVDPAAWAAHMARMAERKRAEEAEERDRHRRAQDKARSWLARSAAADPAHPYLVRKRVSAHGLRQSGGLLLIPVQDAEGVVWSVQTIDAQGNKRFLTGGRKGGCFSPIGLGEKPSLVMLCEGYATGATLYERTGHPVAVAFDAGNLKPVALALRARDLACRYATSIATIWRWSGQGLLPRAIKLAHGTTVWPRAELDDLDALREQGASLEQIKEAVGEVNARRAG
ncbi:MAG: hypothetical protein AB1648_07180 [Pseudomonadota bacterium]